MIGYGDAKECSDDRKAIDIFQNFYEVEAVVKIMVSDREDDSRLTIKKSNQL